MLETLETILQSEIIAHGGAISFAQYMEQALYHPVYGYYTGGKQKIGPRGDFITAPELGPLFAYGLSRAFAPVLRDHPDYTLLEFGAGHGQLGFDILRFLDDANALPHTYAILEISPDLVQQQKETLSQLPAHLQHRVHWLTALPPPQTFSGIILANEVVDAIPVHRFTYQRATASFFEHCVGFNQQGFCPKLQPASGLLHTELHKTLKPLLDLPNYPAIYTSEYPLHAGAWMHEISTILQQGFLCIIDYGFPQAEYYHPQRDEGTLMCHYQHTAHTDPLIHLGLQDITTHVNFSHLAAMGQAAGLQCAAYVSQGHFLIQSGIVDYFSDSTYRPREIQSELMLKQALQKLTLPHEMGELFKIFIMSRSVSPAIHTQYFHALQRFDRSNRL
jgi:SAM-dependent MidA family methyltransferase